ncbi:MAG: alpha/beta fold hydrolase, partial [Bacteroidetes bacterium]|nr:alpha/beta fold hydrolase [Bacteroidota bacterium]
MLQELLINDYTCQSGQIITTNLSYELVGRPLHSAPIILINHALTGNSNVGGTNGWWKTLLGPEKTIDTNHFTVLCFNIPGNGYDGKIFNNSEQFCINDIAALFLLGLKKLKIQQLFAIIGGSIGGAIAWEMT